MARIKKPSGRSFGKVRSINKIRRLQGNQEPKKSLTIVCEGKKTEPNYFFSLKSDLRISTLDIQIIGDQGAPISIVDRAIIEKEKQEEGDEVWGVFDVEVIHNNPTFQKAVDKARQNEIYLAISNPSFEYWYILHFERTNKPFQNPDRVVSHLKKFLPNYEKNVCIYSEISPLTKHALKNASLLRKASVDDWRKFPNSSTTVDLLLKRIREFSE